MGFSGSPAGQESTYKAGDPGSIPGFGRFPGGEHGNPLQYSCQENPMDREVWGAAVQDLDTTEQLRTAKHKDQRPMFRMPRQKRPLVIQSLGLCPPIAAGLVLIPRQGTRSHMLKLKTQNAITKGSHVYNWGSHLPRLELHAAKQKKINF